MSALFVLQVGFAKAQFKLWFFKILEKKDVGGDNPRQRDKG
jgi:hypothetical protein